MEIEIIYDGTNKDEIKKEFGDFIESIEEKDGFLTIKTHLAKAVLVDGVLTLRENESKTLFVYGGDVVVLKDGDLSVEEIKYEQNYKKHRR